MYVQPIDRDEVEALLSELGFRYHPDPMGRLDQGAWRDGDRRQFDGQVPAALAGELLLVADEKDKKQLRGTRNPKVRRAIERGNRKHEEFDERIRRKPGWEKRNYHQTRSSKYFTPDATTPRGHTVELKPDSPSGRRAARRQTRTYSEVTKQKNRQPRSKAIFYPVEDETGPKVRKATPRAQLEAKRKYSIGARISQHPYLEFHRRRATGPGGYRIRVKRLRRKILLP